MTVTHDPAARHDKTHERPDRIGGAALVVDADHRIQQQRYRDQERVEQLSPMTRVTRPATNNTTMNVLENCRRKITNTLGGSS